MLILIGIIVGGLILNRLGKILETFAKDRQHISHTTYTDNRQYHYTEVHNHNERAQQPTDSRDTADFRF